MEIQNKENLNRVAIVAVGYNRIKSMQRLLGSLLIADYYGNNVPLVISIDASGDTKLYQYAQQFEWPYGEKYVNIQQERLGLKNHIYQCGDLTRYFKAIILLEDDIFVSPHFYDYVLQTLDAYGEDDRVGQISLYLNEMNGYVGLPKPILQNGSDVYLMQAVSSWGECWNKQMWDKFVAWRDTEGTEEKVQESRLPLAQKKWTRAWSKFYNAYLVNTGKYVIYPQVSLTTNFSDAGEHGGTNNSIVQSSLQQASFQYRLFPFDQLVKYDGFGNNLAIYEMLGLSESECLLDLYGMADYSKMNLYDYILTTRVMDATPIRTFALNMRPLELNIKYNIKGIGIYLYRCKEIKDVKEYAIDLSDYYLKGFNLKELRRYIYNYYIKAFKRKLSVR